MTTLADLVTSYTRTPTATCYLDGKRWRGIQKLARHQKFGESIAGGTADGRDPPTTPRIGMTISWRWGYNGIEKAGFTGEIAGFNDSSYPDRWSLQCKDVLWRADKSSQVLQTDPLNEIAASAAVRYLLTHYGGIPASRLAIPSLPASGAAWGGSEWTLGIETPVQWGDVEQESGGTTALKAAVEICVCLGYWLYADAGGTIRAKQMERRPSQTAREVFQRNLNLLLNGAPQRQQSYESVFNQATVRGANTGVEGAQLYDQWRTTHPLLPAGVYRDFSFSSFLLEYENASDAGAASITEVAKRILNVVSRIPDVVTFRAKADPDRQVGDTVGIIDTGILISSQRNFFIYQIDRELDIQAGKFDDQLSLDGGTGNTGFTTVPPPDASFSWTLMRETLDGVDVVEVALDGSASTSPSGEIVSYDWSTSTPTYASTPNTATGETVVLIFEAADSPAAISLTVTDTTSKTGTFDASVDLTGADTQPPIEEVVSGAGGAAWYVTPDGGKTWNVETGGGDAVAVGTIGAGADDRAAGTAGTYGMLATRGSGGAGGLRQTLDTLATASTNLVSNGGAITSNIWVNEANPARVWFAIGTAVYRSTDGGATKVAMAAAPASVSWIMEDPSVENSVFLLASSDLYNATDPTVGWALLYEGPVGATARQFVRSRDGQVTWVCYTGAPAGEALQRVETGAAADFDATDVRSLVLDRNATSLAATLYASTGDDPAQIWSFDGLTGLDAVQSTQTFPAGATVQHMLHSRLFDVIYTADFDSIASGQGAFRKYFPQSDVLLLWKQLASGQQGHMLGLGARATAPAEVLRMTIAVDPGGVHHYRDSFWTFRPLPVSGTVRGVAIVADTFNPSRWLAVFNNDSVTCYDGGGKIIGDDWGYSPLWETEDAGATWTEVLITPPPGWIDGTSLLSVAFNDQVGNSWAAAFENGGTFYTAVALGSGATVNTIVEGSTTSAPYITGGADGEWLLSVNFSAAADGLRYLDTSNIFHTPAGTAINDVALPDRMPGTSRVAFVGDNSDLYHTADYRSAQPTLLLAGKAAQAVSVGHAALYYSHGGDVFRIVDPTGAATVTQLLFGNGKSYPRVDRQTRTLMGVAVGGSVLIDDGTTTTTIPPPGDEGLLSSNSTGTPAAFEIIVRQ
jgi:hypothetical protein